MNNEFIGSLPNPITSGAAARGAIVWSTNPSNDQTVIFNGVTYTFKTSAGAEPDVQIGASLTITMTNLATVLNASANGSINVATYVASATTLFVNYDTLGTGGNAYTLGAGTSGGTITAATLLGGQAAASAGGMTIGDDVTDGTAGSVLFVGAGAVLAQNNTAFKWTDADTQLALTAGGATKTPLLITGAAAQSADLLQVKNSGGTEIFDISAAGYLTSGDQATAKLTQNSAGFKVEVAYDTPFEVYDRRAELRHSIVFWMLTPAQFTSNQNDYAAGNPTVQRWSSDASRNVTGMAAPINTTEGTIRYIINVGSFDIVLINASGSSAAANQFLTTTGADITLTANQMAFCIYDGTSDKWRVSKMN